MKKLFVNSLNINSIKNKEKGKRVFILGNGPSILSEDLSRLKSEVVIGVNGSTALEKKYGFQSKYYVVSDQRFLDHPEKVSFATSLLSPKTVRVFREGLIFNDCKKFQRQTLYVSCLGQDGFSYNLQKGYFFGCSTVNLALQLAHHLGAEDIYLLGVDLKYSGKNLRCYEEKSISPVDPFRGIQVHNIAVANDRLKNKGIGLHNCSKDSVLRPYVGYVDFSSLF